MFTAVKTIFADIKTIYVLGGPDTGKTTLCRALGADNQRIRTGYLDADPGQSVAGPPTTLGLRVGKKEYHRFIGTTSPSYNMKPFIDSLRHLSGIGKKKSWKLIVDSSGWIDGDGGTQFQLESVKAVKPELILAIQRNSELNSILDQIDKNISVIVMQPNPEVTPKTRSRRKEYRQEKFAEYFSARKPRTIPLKRRREIGSRPDSQESEKGGLLAALCGRNMLVRKLGVIESYDAHRGKLILTVPKHAAGPVKTIIYGKIYIDPETGEELGYRENNVLTD
ncbi:MAG: Clp1/GlmU family protein [Spirochaetia bacterium]